ncbi:MFS transporter [Kineococcus sp. NBC_00420]|uniref:MFS transporter n=1 Tax=Kineococcus sp. NBC_00420 TaxID=2903564 RepID=UPI002E24735E
MRHRDEVEEMPTAGVPPAPEPPDSPHARVVITIASLGFFLITLDISIVNVALSAIRAELGGGVTGQQWIIDGYTLLFACLLLFAGNLSDRIGAKRALALGVVVFTITSAACAAAPSAGALIAARCAQGAGAAIMLPASMALVREAFPEPGRRARALGIWAVGGAVAGLLGQPLGGFLTSLDWRWVFLVNVPVCGGMLVFLTRVATSPRRPSPFDVAGQVLAVLGLSALVFGLIDGGHRGFTSPTVVANLVLAVAAIAGFIVVQARAAHPMVPLDLFRARGVRIALPVGFAFMVGNFGNVFVVSLYLQQHLGLTPLRAGLVFVPSAVLAVAGNLASGPVTNRFGARVPVVAGLTSMVAGLLGLAATVGAGSVGWTALCVCFFGAGGSLAMPSVTSVVLEGVAPERSGTASAVFNTFRQIGGAVAIAVFGALVSGEFLAGARASFLISAALLLGAALLSLRVPTRTV